MNGIEEEDEEEGQSLLEKYIMERMAERERLTDPEFARRLQEQRMAPGEDARREALSLGLHAAGSQIGTIHGMTPSVEPLREFVGQLPKTREFKKPLAPSEIDPELEKVGGILAEAESIRLRGGRLDPALMSYMLGQQRLSAEEERALADREFKAGESEKERQARLARIAAQAAARPVRQPAAGRQPKAAAAPREREKKRPPQAAFTAAKYGKRLESGAKDLAALEAKGVFRLPSFWDKLGRSIRKEGPSAFQDTNIQILDALQERITNAYLRDETGAAIAKHEAASKAKEVLPSPWDTPETMAYKRRKLLEDIELYKNAAGDAWYMKPEEMESPRQRLERLREMKRGAK
jgi:hypothetical protein